MTANQIALQAAIERHLNCIESIIGPGYKITLVCRYVTQDGLDKDILLTLDESEAAVATIRKMVKRPRLGNESQN